MRSRSNGGVIGAYALPTQNGANGVFFIHDAAIYNTGTTPIWPLGTGYITQTSNTTTGVTVTTAVDNSNYKVTTFKANGTFSVVTGSAYIDILVVGGGGSSAYDYFSSGTQARSVGGGGGGAVALVQGLFVDSGTTFTVEVGAGGTVGSYGVSPIAGVSGSSSKITSNRGHSVTARGGGGGGNSGSVAKVGGSGGGGFQNWVSTATYTYGAGGAAGSTDSYSIDTANITYYQNAGGTGNTATTQTTAASTAGGGGGASEAGYDGSYSTVFSLRGYGGNGFLWNKTGYYYGAGGAGGSFSNSAQSGLYFNGIRAGEGAKGTDGYGVGGGGFTVSSAATSTAPGAGSSGTVIFVYRYR